jgi:hypothetical protein
VQPAIFATVSGPASHRLPSGFVHHETAARRERAWA